MIHFNTFFRTGSVFWHFKIGSIFNGVSSGETKCLSSDVRFENYGSKTKLFNDCFFTVGYISWKVCSCSFFNIRFYISLRGREVEVLLFGNKSGYKTSSVCGIFFSFLSIVSSLLLISVSFETSNRCKNVLAFFLIGFLKLLWNGFTASNENESSGINMICSALTSYRFEKRSFPKSLTELIIRIQDDKCAFVNEVEFHV